MLLKRKISIKITVYSLVILIIGAIGTIFANEPFLIFTNTKNSTQKTVIVDAGHGGFDGGAVVGDVLEKDINLKIATLISIFGVLGAIIGANLSVHTDVNILRKCFGIFLAIISIHEIYTIIKRYKK